MADVTIDLSHYQDGEKFRKAADNLFYTIEHLEGISDEKRQDAAIMMIKHFAYKFGMTIEGRTITF